MSGCAFCALASGTVERTLVHEDERAVVVRDLQPVNPAHALVLPKGHSVGLADLDEETAAHLLTRGMRAAAALRRSPVRCDGVNIWVADGEAAGQEVLHFHMHVVPRFVGDPFRIVMEGGWTTPRPRVELDAVAEQIREHWK